jgi:hypothetical protein
MVLCLPRTLDDVRCVCGETTGGDASDLTTSSPNNLDTLFESLRLHDKSSIHKNSDCYLTNSSGRDQLSAVSMQSR